MSDLYDQKFEGIDIFKRFEKLAKQSFVIKVLLSLLKETYYFIRAVRLDMPHCINVIYVVVSLGSLRSDLLNAILLLDIVKKIPQLS